MHSITDAFRRKSTQRNQNYSLTAKHYAKESKGNIDYMKIEKLMHYTKKKARRGIKSEILTLKRRRGLENMKRKVVHLGESNWNTDSRKIPLRINLKYCNKNTMQYILRSHSQYFSHSLVLTQKWQSVSIFLAHTCWLRSDRNVVHDVMLTECHMWSIRSPSYLLHIPWLASV